MAQTSRRSLLAGLAALPVIAPIKPAVAAPNALADLDRLWRALLDVTAVYRVCSKAYSDATDSLPWWTQPGPTYLAGEGPKVPRSTSGWPAIKDAVPPGPGLLLKVRFDTREINGDYQRAIWHLGEIKAREIRDRRLAELHQRIADRDAVRIRAGFPAIEAEEARLAKLEDEISEQIQALDAGVHGVAARILMHAHFDAMAHHRFADGEMVTFQIALEALLPLIGGPVAETAAGYLNNPERPFCYGPLWSGYVTPGLTADELRAAFA